MTLFDTDVLVWALRGNENAIDVLDPIQDRAISAITYMELLRGARDARDSALTKRFIKLGGFTILPITEAITNSAVSIMETLALKSGLDPMDALIFATALDGGHTLYSGNYKHFKDVDGLQGKTFRP